MIRNVVLVFSLLFLGFGYFFRTKLLNTNGQKTPLINGIHPLVLSALGWILFGVYWLMHYSDYEKIGDSFNMLVSIAALPFFIFIAYRELNEMPGNGLEGLRFLSGITVVSMGGYALISEVPVLEISLEFVNAYLVSGFLAMCGFPAEAGSIDYSGNPLWYRTNGDLLSVPVLHNGSDEILITLSCTAFSSLLLFGAAILSAREPRERKLTTALIILPAIFIFNIIRMAMIAYFTYTGFTSAAFAHHILGKVGSLLALLFLAWVLFTFLPSILESVSEVFDIFFSGSDEKSELEPDSAVKPSSVPKFEPDPLFDKNELKPENAIDSLSSDPTGPEKQ